MRVAPATADESQRLALLRSLDLLDSAPEPAFDALTRLAARMLGVPVALVSLVDEQRQWFKSRVGLDAPETARDLAFCAHAIHGDGPFVVPDAAGDERFFDNPLVTGAPFVRAYAGIPLRSADGHALGTLCAIDHKPRQFSASDIELLGELAEVARREILHREAAMRARIVSDESLRAITDSEALYHATFDKAAIGIALVGLDGRWLRFNSKLCAILRRRPDELVRLTFQDITHPDDLDLDLGQVARLLQGQGEDYTLQKRYLRPDGSLVWAQLTVTLVRKDGEPLHFIAVIEDISARREAEEALWQLHLQLEQRVDERTAELRSAQQNLSKSEQRLNAIVNDQTEIVCRFDQQGRLVFANKAGLLAFGLDDLERRPVSWNSVVWPPDYPAVAAELRKLSPAHPVVVTQNRLVGSGEPLRWAEFVNHGFYDEQGRLREVQTVGRDITERKRLEAELAEAHGRLQDLYEHAPCGYYSIDQQGRYLQVNRTALQWLGVSAEEAVGRLGPQDFFSAEGQQQFRDHFPQFLATGRFGPMEFDLLGRQGRQRRVSVAATAVRDAEGRFLMSRSVMFDVSELERVRNALQRLNREQALMLDSELIGIVKLKDRTSLWCNRALETMFGYAPGELENHPARLLYPDDATYEALGRAAYPVLQSGGSYRTQLQLRRKSGEPIWVDVSGTLLSAETGESMWLMLDITAMKQHQAQVERMAFHDALTGLPNRLLLRDRLSQAMPLCERSGWTLAACYIDLDGFKAVNDRHGHEAGDVLLQTIATRLTHCVRGFDTVARLGGDEFVLVLSQLHTPGEAEPVLRRVLEAVSRSVELGGGRSAQVGASMGVAFYPGDQQEIDTLLAAADAAMYQAKQAGKGQIRRATPG